MYREPSLLSTVTLRFVFSSLDMGGTLCNVCMYIHIKLKFLAGAKFHGVVPSEEIFVVLNLHTQARPHPYSNITCAMLKLLCFLVWQQPAKLKRNIAPFEINRKEALLQCLMHRQGIFRGLGYVPQGKLN